MTTHTLTLTRDELLVLLRILGAPTLNGLDGDLLADVDEREATERLNSGFETLAQRGLVERIGEDISVDNELIALVGSCLLPEAASLLSQVRPDGAVEPHYFYGTPYLLVEHSSPRPGIHRFTRWPSAEALETRVQLLLAPLRTNPIRDDEHEQQIADQTFAQALMHLRNQDPSAAEELLLQAAWPLAAVEAFTAMFVGPYTLWAGRAVWGMDQPVPAGELSGMVLSGHGQQWVAMPGASQPTQIIVRTANGEDCVQLLSGLVVPLTTTHKQPQA